MAVRDKKCSRKVTERESDSNKRSEAHIERPSKNVVKNLSDSIAAEKSNEPMDASAPIIAVFEIVKAEVYVEPALDAQELEHFGT